MRWKPVPEWSEFYSVSTSGQVYSTRSRKVLKNVVDRGSPIPYLQVTLANGPRRERRRIHELVLTTFAGPCPPGHEARHLNGDPADNHWPRNLAWGTPVENARDRAEHGNDMRGERNYNSKLTTQDVLCIKMRLAAGDRVADIARTFSVAACSISDIKHGRHWAWLTVPDELTA